MNKLKDFLYDKSDILIAIVILLIAALVIAWRLASIVEYPKELIDNHNATVYEEPETETPADTPADQPEDDPEGDSEGTSTPAALWDNNGLLTRDVTVTFVGDSATAIVDCAVNEGLFEDYYDYANVCLNNGITDPEQIPVGGTITFETGSSQLDVAKKIKGIS